MSEARPEYRLHDDFSLTPAYVLGYAFHALGRVDERTPARGRRGAVALLTELLATISGLGLDESLAAAEPLRNEKESLSRSPHSQRIGAASAARVLEGLTIVEEAVRSELRDRGAGVAQVSRPPSRSLLVLLGQAALARCPEVLRADLLEGCRALDVHLYTAAVFHCYRVWEQLPGSIILPGDAESIVSDPRLDPDLRCTRADATGLLTAIRARLEA